MPTTPETPKDNEESSDLEKKIFKEIMDDASEFVDMVREEKSKEEIIGALNSITLNSSKMYFKERSELQNKFLRVYGKLYELLISKAKSMGVDVSAYSSKLGGPEITN